jgi:anti-sigma factor RsiW
MSTRVITDLDIQALADNELSRADAERVRNYIEKNPEAHERYEEILRQKELLKRWWTDKRKM